MEILLEKAGKKFVREWIFRNLELSLSSGSRTVMLGANGSGKSTFLQLVSGYLLPSEGKLAYRKNGSEVDPSEIYSQVALAAPYLEVPEELTFSELIKFHFRFKEMADGLNEKSVLEYSGLSSSGHKMIRHFSSGMKQRVRLTLAICSNTPVLLLDEPCSNLDAEAISWYNELLRQYVGQRTLLVCSNNQENEFLLCNDRLNISQWKNGS